MCRCWDDLESRLWWIIKTPILLSIFVSTLHLFTWITKTKQCDHRKHSGNTSFSVVCVWFDPQTNFAIFLNISRIIVQKTKSTHVMQTEPQPYRWAPTHLFLHHSHTFIHLFLSVCDLPVLCRPLQDARPLHSAASPSVRSALRGVRSVSRTRRCEASTLPRVSFRILPGNRNCHTSHQKESWVGQLVS